MLLSLVLCNQINNNKMKVSFLIKSAGKSEVKTIFAQFYHDGKKTVLATRFSIPLNDWDAGQPKKNNRTADLRKGLLDYEKQLNNFINEVLSNSERVPTKEELKTKLDVLNNGEKQEFLTNVFERYIKSKSKELNESTLRITSKAKELLDEYNPKLNFADITPAFNLRFQNYLLDRDTQNVTANNYLRKIKAMLNWAYDQRICKVNVAKNIKLLKEIEKPIFVVEEQELQAIEHGYNLQNSKPVELGGRLERIKDLFLFGAYTGLRFNDLQSLTEDNYRDGKLKVMTEKTLEPVVIPLIPEALHIWNKYEQQLPQISNMKANVYLKELFKLHGLDRKILEVEQKGGETLKIYTPLCDCITFHKSRKTFIVNALKAGIPTEMVMRLSGHKQHKTFRKYVSFAEDVLEAEMLKMSRSARSMKVAR